ncbi:MAG TPA: SsrA-binding protein [Persephonella sp.]|uniref:SsrA-binding protein n=1 Tax=Persephonella marina (strain DSM 14350 / EX-H1) TaxID=123214 RepID=SSRP_PERMH|nr:MULTISPECIES: SsrA-binding protein SmpB [Persephonella]C0QUM8.1 RecName: Full=SsrA-binding protein; AltName: Full=Small protein B [Persephonella marina EX-H1]ACO04058.1 SsrA-binding protein [Persephonella marina EX-H1]HCB69990.1 SsrA-binding protein [Persephonella sp.]
MGIKVVATNKVAYHNYNIIETYEAGIVLKGSEVKSIREGSVNLRDSFVRIDNGEAFIYNMYIAPYKPASKLQHDPYRKRKLLLHKREILKLMGKVQEKGLTIIPTKVYLKNGKVKIEIALAKGKAKYEKREAIKERDMKRELSKKYKGKIKL